MKINSFLIVFLIAVIIFRLLLCIKYRSDAEERLPQVSYLNFFFLFIKNYNFKTILNSKSTNNEIPFLILITTF